MPAREDGGEDLLDDFVLADDDLLQFLLHHAAVLAELLQNIAQAPLFDGGDGSGCGIGSIRRVQGSGFRVQNSAASPHRLAVSFTTGGRSTICHTASMSSIV